MPEPVIPSVALATARPSKVDVLIIGIAESGDKPALVGLDATLDKTITKKLGMDVLELALSMGATTKKNSCTMLPPVDGMKIIVVGMGKGEPTPECVRRAAAVGVRSAAGDEPVSVAIDLECDDPEMVQGVTEGALLGAYSITKVTQKEQEKKYSQITILTQSKDKEAAAALETAKVTAENVYLARDWVNAPANILYPETWAAEAKAVADGTKITVEILDDKRLVKEGWNGVMAVGGGSQHLPRVVRYSYAPRGAKFHLVFVGKGMTFDAGGLNLKTADGMYTMKCDMGGAATVLAATRAIAQLGLKIKVTCYAGMAENMPDGAAYRPSDVITMKSGKTIENANTDAEGRIVLADCLTRAGEDEPDLLIDVATLTGACVVALGNRTAGIMASDDQTADAILDAADVSGEQFWQLPMYFDQLLEGLDSKIADIKTSGGRAGGAMTAAAFLHEFVDPDTPWAHLDIAGPAFNTEGPFGHVPAGGTGHGVRTLVALAQGLSA